MVEVGEAKKQLHLLHIHWTRPLGNTSNLDRVHCNGIVEDDHSEILDCGLLNFAFVSLEVQLVLLEDLQDLSGDLSVLVKGLCKYKDVVQVDYHHTFCNELLKDVIHHHMKGGQTIGEAKEYNKQLEQATVHPEGSPSEKGVMAPEQPGYT